MCVVRVRLAWLLCVRLEQCFPVLVEVVQWLLQTCGDIYRQACKDFYRQTWQAGSLEDFGYVSNLCYTSVAVLPNLCCAEGGCDDPVLLLQRGPSHLQPGPLKQPDPASGPAPDPLPGDLHGAPALH